MTTTCLAHIVSAGFNLREPCLALLLGSNWFRQQSAQKAFNKLNYYSAR